MSTIGGRAFGKDSNFSHPKGQAELECWVGNVDREPTLVSKTKKAKQIISGSCN